MRPYKSTSKFECGVCAGAMSSVSERCPRSVQMWSLVRCVKSKSNYVFVSLLRVYLCPILLFCLQLVVFVKFYFSLSS